MDFIGNLKTKNMKNKIMYTQEQMLQLWYMKGGKNNQGKEITFEECLQSLQPTVKNVNNK